ncbi:MAG: AAA family ATPase [Bacilli bacterium]|nr:AAA family ATPase [Bacilli bacterium]
MGKKTAEDIKYVSDSFGTIALALKDSKLEIEKTDEYKDAIKHITEFYDINERQAWILSLFAVNYFDSIEIDRLKKISEYVSVSTLKILRWVEDIKFLYLEKKYLKYTNWSLMANKDIPVNKITVNTTFGISKNMEESIVNNKEFVMPINTNEPKKEDYIGQIFYIADKIEDLRLEDAHYLSERGDIEKLEKDIAEENPTVKRLVEHNFNLQDRWFLYGIMTALCKEGVSSVSLEGMISNFFKTYGFFDLSSKHKVYRDMMDNKYPLFKNGYLTFTEKGTLTDAEIGLTWKGKKLLLGKDAVLYSDSFNEKDIIKSKDIFKKKLFYSEKNDKEISKLTLALQEKSLKNIQSRLKKDGLPIGINILLYGLPGTGKTESVLQIAKATGRDVIHINNSELRSCWYGDSEKIVKKVFSRYAEICETYKELGKKIPILLFNEADAILSKRVEVGASSTAKVENNIQNILLEEMENMKGIMIATTNLLDNLDSAFERRFLFKIKFDNPSFDAKRSIWSDKLPWMTETDVNTLAKEFDFSGGQIDNISRKIAITEILDGNKPNFNEIKEMCNNEKCMGYVSGRIGFDI